MNRETALIANSMLSVRDQFPAVGDWHYLDSAATAQKPQAVIDAITQAYARDYATVHRGVYERSVVMTDAYEGARAAASRLIGGQPSELVFTRNATEAINLVARTLPKDGRNRVLLSQLEHHSNIVPWQLAGYDVDAVPLTPDGQIDLDAAEAMLTQEHRIVAFAHVSNVLGSILDAKRAAEIAHSKGALLLLDGCQAVPRLPVDVAAIGADFYAFSAHKLYGPTGIGCLWGRAELLQTLPPWQGGGSMIEKVTFEETTYLDPPMRFEEVRAHPPQHASDAVVPRQRDVVDELYARLTKSGESFWNTVYPAYMERDITRTDVREVVRRGLEEARGSYKIVVRLFNMDPRDYKKFLNFLRKHQCQLPFKVYREVDPVAFSSINHRAADRTPIGRA